MAPPEEDGKWLPIPTSELGLERLGVRISTASVLRVTRTVALGLHLGPAPWPSQGGAVVLKVEPGSPMAEAEPVAPQEGDIVVAFDGRCVLGLTHLELAELLRSAGVRVTLKIATTDAIKAALFTPPGAGAGATAEAAGDNQRADVKSPHSRTPRHRATMQQKSSITSPDDWESAFTPRPSSRPRRTTSLSGLPSRVRRIVTLLKHALMFI